MLLVFLAGLLVGGGVWLALGALQPSTTPLALAAQRLQRPGRPMRHSEASSTPDDSLAARLGRLLLPHVSGDRLQKPSLVADLAIVGRPFDVHLGQKVLWAMLGALAMPVSVALFAMNGVHFSLAVPAWVSLLGGFGGFVLPDSSVSQLASARRREFRQCLGAYIDLVVMLLAANEGVTGALEHAANAGDTWPFAELRRVLAEARLTATTPWQAMRELGERYGVDELIELASSAHLAGTEGASVRQSLVAKARTLRDRSLSAEEAEAERASTRMVFPLLLLVLSFVIFVGYPALISVLRA
jgi:tight adherence protein C